MIAWSHGCLGRCRGQVTGLSHSADTESESNTSSTCCSSSLSTKTVSLLDRLHAPTPATLARKWKIVFKFQNNYKNNRGLLRNSE